MDYKQFVKGRRCILTCTCRTIERAQFTRRRPPHIDGQLICLHFVKSFQSLTDCEILKRRIYCEAIQRKDPLRNGLFLFFMPTTSSPPSFWEISTAIFESLRVNKLHVFTGSRRICRRIINLFSLSLLAAIIQLSDRPRENKHVVSNHL